MTIRNGFVWLPITNKAKEVFASQLFDVYKLHDDGSESLCESYADINDAIEYGIELAIEVGSIESKERDEAEDRYYNESAVDGWEDIYPTR